MFNPKKFYKVDYILTIYDEIHSDEWHRHYFEKVLHGIAAIDYPIQLVVVYDEKSPQSLLDYIKGYFPTAKFLCRNPFPVDTNVEKYLFCEWGMIKAYNESTADFVCFNHSDDIPFSNRVDLQIQSLLQYPKAVLSLAGHWITVNRQSRQVGFHEVQYRGSPCFSCPSSFMWNKKTLPQIEPHWKHWQAAYSSWDIVIILEMLQNHQVVAVHHPLMVYNYHGLAIKNGKAVTQQEQIKCDQKFFRFCEKYHLLKNKKYFKLFPPSKNPIEPVKTKVPAPYQLRDHVEILLPVTNPKTDVEKQLFITVLKSLENAEGKVVLLCDDTVSLVTWEIIHQYRYDIHLNQSHGFWEAITPYYNKSKAEYIALCDMQSVWIVGKLLVQLRALRDSDSPLVFCAYNKILYLNDNFDQTVIRTPSHHDHYGCANIMSSMWVFNKHRLPTLPKIPSYPNRIIQDTILAIRLTAWIKTVPVINIPLMTYHTLSIDVINKETLHQCFLETCDYLTPRFQYLYPVFPQCLQPNEGDRF
jgi:hypothetical protein